MRSLLQKIPLLFAICLVFLSVPRLPAWCGQSTPPQKETAGSEAGSSGKSPAEMGSKSGEESEMRVGKDETKTEQKKTEKKKPAQKNKAKAEKAPAKTTSTPAKN